ncbi:MAG: response regulator transcription factor, partial [Calditrichaeota bacterium]|nr:response regulator transcription factor [Calditrichota bacterium]
KSNIVDLLISDININGTSIFTVLKQNEASSFHIILVSKHIERAYEAFEYNVIDFIRKPFMEDRLLKAIEKYNFLMANKLSPVQQIAVRQNNSIKLINVNEIRYFEGYGPHVKVYKNDGTFDLLEKSLERIDQLVPKSFVRIHRSFIVNSDQIVQIETERRICHLNNNSKLPISQSKLKLLKQQVRV